MMHRRPAPAPARFPGAPALFCLILACGTGSCAAPPPAPAPGHVLGYGTPGVSAYVPERAADLRALQADCAGVPPPAPSATEGLPAACAQLRGTLRNQPGNDAVPDPVSPAGS